MPHDPEGLPVYLATGRAWLEEGPSLVVETPGYSLARYPLARLSRVMISEDFQIAPEAVAALLDAGCTLVWLWRGKAVGIGMALAPRPRPPADRMRGLFAGQTGRRLYRAWLEEEQARALKEAAKLMGVRRLRRIGGEALLRHWEQALPEDGLRAMLEQQGHAALVGAASEALAREGVEPEGLARPDEGWNWIRDAADILLWELRARSARNACALLDAWHRAQDASAQARLVIGQVETHREHWMRRAWALWRSMLGWLDRHEPWRRANTARRGSVMDALRLGKDPMRFRIRFRR